MQTALTIFALIAVALTLPLAIEFAHFRASRWLTRRRLQELKAQWHGAADRHAGDSKCEKSLRQARDSISEAWLCNMDGNPWSAKEHLRRAETAMRQAEIASTREQREALASRRAADFDAWFADHSQAIRQSSAAAQFPGRIT